MARISGMPGIVLLVAAIGMALSLLSAGQASAALFTQCPPTGDDTGCGILITVNPDNTITITAASSPSQPPYESVEDTLIGVVNNSNSSVASIPLSSTTDIFGFDGDGICTVTPHAAGCPFPGATGYEGPGVSFSGINAAGTSGIVNFNPVIPPGGSTFFGLEEALTATDITPGPPSPGPVNGVPEPSSLLLISSGLVGLGGAGWRRARRK